MDIAEKVLRQKKDFDDVYEAGKKAEYDAFWDSFKNIWQMQYLFAGSAWNDTTFKPKYDLIVGKYNCSGMFMINQVSNIKSRLLECGVKLDLSQCVNFLNGFSSATTTELPEIDLSNCDNVTSSFSYMSKLINIDKVTFKNGVTFISTFFSTPNLEEIRIGGTISGSGFDIHWSTKLTADSLKSIINALSTTTTGLTITLPTTAQANYEAVYGSGSWSTLVATRSNWTIAYA